MLKRIMRQVMMFVAILALASLAISASPANASVTSVSATVAQVVVQSDLDPNPALPKDTRYITVDTTKMPSTMQATAWMTLTIYDDTCWNQGCQGFPTPVHYTFNMNNYHGACVNIGNQNDPPGTGWNNRTQSAYLNATGYVTLYRGPSCSSNVITTPTSTSPWKRCKNDGAYGPWFGGCNRYDEIMPSSFYYP